MKDKAAKRAANRLRDKRRRKRKHARQIESRLKNEYYEYLSKMNDFEYNTWLSEVTNSEEQDKIYCSQVANKENILKELRKNNLYKNVLLNSYDIIKMEEIMEDDKKEDGCIIC
tara:strand:- start:20 stop:361 length:342 start_codon:yes stop_codon:yes gene_type:complete